MCIHVSVWSFANDLRLFVCATAVQWHDLHFLSKSVKSKATVGYYVPALYELLACLTLIFVVYVQHIKQVRFFFRSVLVEKKEN